MTSPEPSVDPPSAPYSIKLTPTARRELASLDEAAYAALVELIEAIAGNPHRLGGILHRPPYEGVWRAKRGEYRVLYLIDEDTDTVTVTAARHRRDAYRT